MLTTASPAKIERIAALDFTKGALVLFMVLYHWINYFIGPLWQHYRYLRFLTPSFIFVTGFMISHVYLAKYDASDVRLSKRLFTRGLKLMGVFLVLNAARALIVPALHTGALGGNLLDPRNIFAIFVSGNFPIAGAKLISFSILVPISYLLMLSGILMVPFRYYRYTFHVACILLFLSIVMLALLGAECQNLELIAIGMLGVLTGFAPMAKINKIHSASLCGWVYVSVLRNSDNDLECSILASGHRSAVESDIDLFDCARQCKAGNSGQCGYPARQVFVVRIHISNCHPSDPQRMFAIIPYWSCITVHFIRGGDRVDDPKRGVCRPRPSEGKERGPNVQNRIRLSRRSL